MSLFMFISNKNTIKIIVFQIVTNLLTKTGDIGYNEIEKV
ncbi:hypothetical protein SAMN05216464_110229 [Mucilaginibacter pineti]|uniref:Uncharacterized protein n=1 Tax=Mucilaginibacter pineti TaxID=1391627 RepID=A0A1G7GP57_9SPHI|nr:hypothetical protein SAMN05216464_110229 [Mucilaginibacter pineti]